MCAEKFEEFPLVQYKERYLVSNKGRIFSKRKKSFLKTEISNGYNIVYVNKVKSKRREIFRVDILIATAFLGNSNLFLNHIDSNQLNDTIENLEWVDTCIYLSKIYGAIWKPIKSHEKYFISNDGRVWSLFSREIMKQQIISEYMSVNIDYPHQFFQHIHRIVASAFCDNSFNKQCVNHKDGNKMNNNFENLEWVSVSENSIHAIENLPRKIRHNIKVSKFIYETAVCLDWLPMYYICRDGRVYSDYTHKYMTLTKNGSGYYRVYCKVSDEYKSLYVHKLVAEAYIKKTNVIYTQVNHKNLNKLDNTVENLEWCTAQENIQHSKVENPNQFFHLQKQVVQIDRNTGEILNTFQGIKIASRTTKINSGSIVKVCQGKKPSAGGYKWKYIDQ